MYQVAMHIYVCCDIAIEINMVLMLDIVITRAHYVQLIKALLITLL